MFRPTFRAETSFNAKAGAAWNAGTALIDAGSRLIDLRQVQAHSAASAFNPRASAIKGK